MLKWQKNKQMLHRHCHDTKTALDKKTDPKPKLQDLPEGYSWVDDMLILRQEYTHKKGHLKEELCRQVGYSNLPGLV